MNSFKHLSKYFPLKFLILFKWISLEELLKSFTITELHLNVKDFDTLLWLLPSYYALLIDYLDAFELIIRFSVFLIVILLVIVFVFFG